jgi:outer membrane receptor for monomeric catechols
MRQVEIKVDRDAALKRFEQATWKQGRMLEQPQSAKQVWNLQADHEETADSGLMLASFEQHLWKGVELMREYVDSAAYGENQEANTFIINLVMPQNWVVQSQAGLKFALLELIQNGMLADWYDDVKPDQSKAYKQKAEVNKAEIHSIIYSLNPPSV